MDKSELRRYANEANQHQTAKEAEEIQNWKTNNMKLADEVIEKIPERIKAAAKGGQYKTCVHHLLYYEGWCINQPRKKVLRDDYSPDCLHPWDRKIYDYCVRSGFKTRLMKYIPYESTESASFGIEVSW